jgi:alpha-glucosidase
VKAGAIIPKYPVQQYVENYSLKSLLIRCLLQRRKRKNLWFIDAQDGYDYKKEGIASCHSKRQVKKRN